MAATPEVAMTLALLGTRLRRMGMVASAAWSKRLPSTDDRCLHTEQVRHVRAGTTFWTRSPSWEAHPRVMQASRTTCERRSLAESLNAASMSRSCCRKPSNSAAPARSSERTFFSWKTRRRLSAGLPPEQLWGRGAGVRLQPPL